MFDGTDLDVLVDEIRQVRHGIFARVVKPVINQTSQRFSSVSLTCTTPPEPHPRDLIAKPHGQRVLRGSAGKTEGSFVTQFPSKVDITKVHRSALEHIGWGWTLHSPDPAGVREGDAVLAPVLVEHLVEILLRPGAGAARGRLLGRRRRKDARQRRHQLAHERLSEDVVARHAREDLRRVGADDT